MTRSILSPRGRRVVGRFARSRVLVAFDYDGTLAPIARTPGAAGMRHATRQLLDRVAELYPCAIVSGRAYADLASRITRPPMRFLFGNHGIEPLAIDRSGAALVRQWVAQLRPQLAGAAGVVVENKTHSIAVHFRAAPDRRRAKRIVTAAVAGLVGARAIDGRSAINVIPEAGANKGTALRQACRLARCAYAIYVGDDGTDEDAFAALSATRLISIRVGRRAGSRARYFIPRQRDIDRLLRLLVTLRAPTATPPRRRTNPSRRVTPHRRRSRRG
jgi:trehalose 6-phosphate phosphatase